MRMEKRWTCSPSTLDRISAAPVVTAEAGAVWTASPGFGCESVPKMPQAVFFSTVPTASVTSKIPCSSPGVPRVPVRTSATLARTR